MTSFPDIKKTSIFRKRQTEDDRATVTSEQYTNRKLWPTFRIPSSTSVHSALLRINCHDVIFCLRENLNSCGS